jgi:ribosomal RNA methyltransferase Nop2
MEIWIRNTVVKFKTTIADPIKVADFLWLFIARNRREEGRDRQSYMQCLKRDLCTYYSYNEFMIEKLLHIFPVGEILEVLEANEVQRPVTIRWALVGSA